MTPLPPDGSRDRRIEEPSNLWLVHPLSRAMLRPALRARLSANAVSCLGLVVGACAAAAFGQWREPGAALVGLVLAVLWLSLDGLDGMVARATGTASPFGRLMDGLCDHGVFVLVYVALASSIGTASGWLLAVAAGAAHALQSSYYEGERARFHRRLKGIAPPPPAPTPAAWLVNAYDRLSTAPDRAGAPLDRAIAAPDVRARYAEAAVAPMRLLALLSANTRVQLVGIACLAGAPQLFWWAELLVLPIVAAIGYAWHRRAEQAALSLSVSSPPGRPVAAPLLFEDHLH
jgi:hypothetical protein